MLENFCYFLQTKTDLKAAQEKIQTLFLGFIKLIKNKKTRLAASKPKRFPQFHGSLECNQYLQLVENAEVEKNRATDAK